MAARSIASLTLSFGLVSIPVKLYTATESSATIRFNLLTKDGQRVRQPHLLREMADRGADRRLVSGGVDQHAVNVEQQQGECRVGQGAG